MYAWVRKSYDKLLQMALHTELAFYIVINTNSKQTSKKQAYSIAEYLNTDFFIYFLSKQLF